MAALLVGPWLYDAAKSLASRDAAPTLPATGSFPPPPATKTRIGLNMAGLATYNRHQVFTNLIAQSEWFARGSDGWTTFPADQLDAKGWIRFLKPGQTAPRPLVIPPAPFRKTTARCVFEGKGILGAGGIANVIGQDTGSITIELDVSGNPGEGAWLELEKTDPGDPLRNIDCRETGIPAGERFHPAFLDLVKPFKILRFLDWQRINENSPVSWASRATPDSGSQATLAGVSIEDMVDLANRTGADPWFLMPYRADPEYVEAFARLVRQRLDPKRTVYVELGNEVWNDMFDAAEQAKREGLALGLGDGDPDKAQAERYAEKVKATMQIWTRVYADRPDHLVRIAAAHNAFPDLSATILGHGDTAQWVDALATAPYFWMDLDKFGPGDLDKVYAQAPAAIEDAFRNAERNREIAARYGKRFVAYEGGQHFVAKNEKLNYAIQRDPRMGDLYREYLDRWDRTIKSDMVLYASIAPIGDNGSWGLQEYGGQPAEEAPKLMAVRKFLDSRK